MHWKVVVDRTPNFETRPGPGPGLIKAGPSGRVPGLELNLDYNLEKAK